MSQVPMGYISDIRKKVGHMPLVIGFSVMLLRGKDGRFLLEERSDDGFWDFPGGSIEFNESAEDAAKRELFEETALKANSCILFGVYSGPLTYYRYANGDVVSGVDVVYLCQDYEGSISPQQEEVKRLAWFDLSSFPEKMSPRNKQITRDLQGKFIK
jgi:8-oxo-dGTP pyrophosphatase MutT (NUDIX family)